MTVRGAAARPPALLLALLPLFSACAVPAGRPSRTAPAAAPRGPASADVVEKRVFRLSKTPDPGLEMALEGILSASHDDAMAALPGSGVRDIGFTYSLAPRGAIYPFSEIEVSCIVQRRYADRRGPELCAVFFGALDARLGEALAGKQ